MSLNEFRVWLLAVVGVMALTLFTLHGCATKHNTNDIVKERVLKLQQRGNNVDAVWRDGDGD